MLYKLPKTTRTQFPAHIEGLEMVNIFFKFAKIKAWVSWGPPLSLQALDGAVGRLVGGRRGLYSGVYMISVQVHGRYAVCLCRYQSRFIMLPKPKY